ncbi:hypothetical protein [Chitinibacter sp. ZOR0017]|uniref:hypothetical protein n=1 Tax=Chitinibacter sp. ZOR0017 TaxID=1339254 RepID=UPI000647D4E3|nr:hypothetical protein [Chitinibacter sp. ZOR0017]
MPRRANPRILALDATFTVLSLGALSYYGWLGEFYPACLSLILLTIAARHLLNDWQSLQITPIQLSLRTTRRSWQIDTMILCLLITAAISSWLRGDSPMLALLTLAGAVLTARHWLNGYHSLHKARPILTDTPSRFGELAAETISGQSR